MSPEELLCWYQERIGLYDKQSWETTVEQHILRGLSYSPCKTAKLKTDLIDVDLVRGSTFPKAKPQSDVWFAGIQGIVRIILCPFYVHWWIKVTTKIGFMLVMSLYCSVISTSVIYYNYHDKLKSIPMFEVYLPFFLLILLSVIHSQMICTRRKGIKVAFACKKDTYVKSRRKSRSVRRTYMPYSKAYCWQNKEGYPRSSFVQDPLTQNQNNNDLHQASHRSRSEDLYGSKTLEKDNRSASENNILHCNVKNLLSYKDKISPKSVPESPIYTKNNSEQMQNENDANLSTPNFKCNVRYRGNTFIENIGNKEIKTKSAYWSNPISAYDKQIGFAERAKREALNYQMTHPDVDQTSDAASEGGCSADCESPITDGEAFTYSAWTNKFKKCIDFKKKQKLNSSSTSHFSPRHSLPKRHSDFFTETNASNSSCESEVELDERNPLKFSHRKLNGWIGITTNSEDPSYSSESEAGWEDIAGPQSVIHSETVDWHIQGAPAAVISSTKQVSDKEKPNSPSTYSISALCFSCKIWEDSEIKKVNLSVLDISSAVISRVDSLKLSSSYLTFGLVMSIILCLLPSLHRLMTFHLVEGNAEGETSANTTSSSTESMNKLAFGILGLEILEKVLGENKWSVILIFLNMVNRLVLSACIFFLLSLAERTFKQRFLYAKHFCYLTSARRARKYELPHFRLNKVINIKAWLSIRSCLKKRGPQHSIDVIVSATFIMTLILVFYLGVETLKDDEKNIYPLHNCELFVWCFAVSIYLVRFMTLGALINKKYSNPSVLITEQINMYFHMEQNPQKKDKLMLANNVLKLVPVLLKELDSPFKISGLSANTFLYNITKFGILSACSGVLSDLLGFKLKLNKIKFF